ncbi:MAG: gluconate 2-dehydrogenase subunit 3 family protein [Acidobacteria bacterium]|nr:gluconate 2-dehydrogenase subunit 3 family protein [Acidobacteriota bacterium]
MDLKRRDLLKNALLGAAAASPAAAQQHVHVTTIAPAQAAATGAAWKPQILDDHQNETVIVLSELIIPTTDTPGGKAAKVNEWVDLYLADLAEDKGHSFLMGLGWLDGYAIKQHGEPFVKLTEPQQVAILEKLDGAKEEDLAPGAQFFKDIKGLTVQGYYTSKIGIDELNKDGVPETFACTHDSHA